MNLTKLMKRVQGHRPKLKMKPAIDLWLLWWNLSWGETSRRRWTKKASMMPQVCNKVCSHLGRRCGSVSAKGVLLVFGWFSTAPPPRRPDERCGEEVEAR